MVNPILVAKLAPIAEAQSQCQVRRSQSLIWLSAALAGLVLLLLRFQANFSVSLWHLLLLVAAALAGGFWVRAQARKRGTDLRAIARKVEQEHPDLHALLLTAMDAAPDARTGDFHYLQKRVIREALAKDLRSPWNQRGRERLFFSQFFHVLSVAVFAAVAAALGFGGKMAPTQESVAGDVEVHPGNAVIERGSSVVITAAFHKKVPSEATLVLLPSNGGSRRLPMARSLEDPVFGNSLMSVETETLYYVEYGQERTEQYRLEVFEHPALVRADASLDYPDYTALPDRVIKDTRRITAVEGTELTYRLLLNKPIVDGSLAGREGGLVDLEADPTQANVYLAQFSLAESDTYELNLQDAEGRTNKTAIDFVIQAQKNRKAVLKLKSPAGDQRFSAVEEVEFEGEVWDDYGLEAYGFAYAIGDGEPVSLEHGQRAGAKEKRSIERLLELEGFDLRPQSLVTYYLWADDLGPDGELRRNYSDMYFAEIRPFEEVFREDQSGGNQDQQEQGQGNSPAMELLQLQKEIINAAWNIQRRESGRQASEQFADDVAVVQESQDAALTQLEQVRQEVEGEKEQAVLQQAKDAMERTMEHLEDSVGTKSPAKLSSAVGTARTAYHYLLQIQPEEFRVSQGQGSGGGGGNRSQRHLNQLEMTDDADGYETQSQAASQQDAQQNEQLQIFNRLKELARRQEDLNRRLQELQTALDAADEEEKEDIEHQLKRLRDQQRQMLEDMDELRQRVANQNTPEAAEALSQLDQVRSEAQQAAEMLEDRQVSQALASGARTQQSLEELRDEYRRESSGQFSQAMQDLRERARQLSQRQDAIRDGLSAAAQEDRKSLAESEEAAQVMENVEQQKEELQSLLEEVRSVSEESESAEPLLSRQLHETYRAVDPAEVNKQLEYASQLARLNLMDNAQEFEAQAHEAVDELQDRIDRAAESVLGDGVESLRRARLVLDELLEEVGNEIADNLPGQESSGGRQPGQPNSENATTQPSSGEPSAENLSPQLAQNGGGSPQSQESAEGRSGVGEPSEQSDETNQSSALRTAWNIGNENNPSGGGNGGPLTGQNFTQFSDRLREVEEMIDVQDLQNEVASVRDRARALRAEFKHSGKEPQWEFVQLQIEKPLAEIQQQVGEELARRLSREAVVPIDRDPVPQQYSELVRRYYETLGGSGE